MGAVNGAIFRHAPARAWVYWIPMAVFLLLCLYRSCTHTLHDFGNYYFGSYFFLKGDFSKDLYDPVIFNRKIAADGFEHIWLSFAPNPPFTTLLFAPFAFLPPTIAKLIFNVLTMVLFMVSYYRLAKHLLLDTRVAAFIPLVFLVPLYNGVQYGQVYLLMFFFLAEGYLALETDRTYTMAVLWSLAILLKIFPGILVLYLLVRKEYKAFWYLTLACAILFLTTLFFHGTDVWIFFLKSVLSKAMRGEATAAAYALSYQSFAMLLKYLFLADTMDNPSPSFDSPLAFTVLTIGIKTIILACLVFAARSAGENRYKAWSLWITASVLLSAYGSTYSCIILIFPLLAAYQNKRILIALSVFSFLLVNVPLKVFSALPVALQFPRLLAVMIIFAMIFALIRPVVNWKIVPLCLLLMLLPEVLASRKKDEGEYALRSGQQSMIMDFRLTNGVLTYRYWSPDGPREIVTDFKAEPQADQLTEVQNGQVFLNHRQITFGSGHKSQAMATSAGVLYLTDEDRGYGFYTLRIIKPSVP